MKYVAIAVIWLSWGGAAATTAAFRKDDSEIIVVMVSGMFCLFATLFVASSTDTVIERTVEHLTVCEECNAELEESESEEVAEKEETKH